MENNFLNPKISQIVYAKLEVGWHHSLNGREFEQAPGGGEGQGNLMCCSPRGPKELERTEQLNNNKARKY